MNEIIVDISAVVLCALGFGLLLIRLKQPPIIGYIITGIILGPYCLKFITDREAVNVLTDLGVIFLLFAIGLNLSIDKIKNIWKQALGVTLLSGIIFILTFGIVGYFADLSNGVVLILTFCAVSSSSAVIVKSLQSAKLTGTTVGDATLGITIVQDIVSLFCIIIIRCWAGKSLNESEIRNFIISVSICAAVVITFILYKKYVIKFMSYLKKQNDILALSTVGLCLFGAVLAMLAGFSPAFGAFVAGLVLGNSVLKEDLKSATAIMEELLLMAFFLSIGLLVNVDFIGSHFSLIFFSLLFLTVGKTVLNVATLRLFRFSPKDSFIMGALLAHLGEFSFVLISEGFQNGMITEESKDFLICLTALSLFFSPFWVVIAERCQKITSRINIDSSYALLKVTSRKELMISIKVYRFLKTLWTYLCNIFMRLISEAAEKINQQKK